MDAVVHGIEWTIKELFVYPNEYIYWSIQIVMYPYMTGLVAGASTMTPVISAIRVASTSIDPVLVIGPPGSGRRHVVGNPLPGSRRRRPGRRSAGLSDRFQSHDRCGQKNFQTGHRRGSRGLRGGWQ
mgnify:CR=1 FL=1